MNRLKLELKYTFNCSPINLFYALYQPQTLKNWMADRVEYDESTHTYTFYWAGFPETARLIEKDEDKLFLKLEWQNDQAMNNQEYLSFQVGEPDDDWFVDLFIEDFCDSNEVDVQREEWDQQMGRLKKLIN